MNDINPSTAALLSLASCYPTDTEAVADPDLHRKALIGCQTGARKHPDFESLSDGELALVAVLLDNFIHAKSSVKAIELLSRIFPDKGACIANLHLLHNLLNRQIIKCTSAMTGSNIAATLVQAEFTLTDSILETLLPQLHSPTDATKPFQSNREFLQAWFRHVEELDHRHALADGPAFLGDELAKCEKTIQAQKETLNARRKVTSGAFPIEELIAENSLDDVDQQIVTVLLHHELKDVNVTVKNLAELLSTDLMERAKIRQRLSEESPLVVKGIVELENWNVGTSHHTFVSLPPRIIDRLTDEHVASSADPLQELLRHQSIFRSVSPEQRFEDLILPSGLLRTIETSLGRYSSDVSETLVKWGIEKPVQGRRPGEFDESPLTILLSGPSGTGKTFAAGAIAHRLGKTLLVTDISKLLSKWIGESEKGVNELFEVHSQIIRRCANPPVLLLNECDQFLQTRGSVDHAADRMYNQMQNLFLERLETIRGVLIATTNLSSHLDEAFSRRFGLKLEFPKPDKELRKMLWRRHLLKTIPLAEDIDIESLAEEFEFTGGQIVVATRNAAVVAASSSPTLLCSEHLMSACIAEANGSLTTRARCGRQYGFMTARRQGHLLDE